MAGRLGRGPILFARLDPTGRRAGRAGVHLVEWLGLACALVWLGFYALRHGGAGLRRGEARLVWAMLACSLANQWLIHPVISGSRPCRWTPLARQRRCSAWALAPGMSVSSSVYLLQSLLGLAWVLWPRRLWGD